MLNRIMFKSLCKHTVIFIVLFVKASYHTEMKKANFIPITITNDEGNININKTESYNNSQSNPTTKYLVTTTTYTLLREKLHPENFTENHNNSQRSTSKQPIVTLDTGTPLRKKLHRINVTGSYNNSQSSTTIEPLVTTSTDSRAREKHHRVNITQNYNNNESGVTTTTDTKSQKEIQRENVSKSYSFGNLDHNKSQYSMSTVGIDIARTTPRLQDKNDNRLRSPSETDIDRRAYYLRQDGPPPELDNKDGPPVGNVPPPGEMHHPSAGGNSAHAAANRYTRRTKRTTVIVRTLPTTVSFKEMCDYKAHNCLKSYETGVVCARTVAYGYKEFKNFCQMDYMNCRERYDLYMIVHMGKCENTVASTLSRFYHHYPYWDDYHLDTYYVLEDSV